MENTRSVALISIPNCDQLKKAVSWLKANRIPFTVRDFRQNPFSRDEINMLARSIGLSLLINRRSTTWRMLQLTEPVSDDILKDAAFSNPTVLKRPIACLNGEWTAGFDESFWREKLL